jgi:hypothetical protein
MVLMIAAFGLAVWAAWLYSSEISFLFALNTVAQWVAARLRKLAGLDKTSLPITSASV